MISQTYKFECITPCFCAGAEQSQKEIRPSSIRGALRWWFRCLGGTLEQEKETFGGADPVTASAIQVRVSAITEKAVGVLPSPKAMTPKAYILHFASIAGGNSSRFGDGPRWNPAACYGTGTTFTLGIRQLRKISPESQEILKNAIVAFKHYGSIGMRITRGLGAIQSTDVMGETFKQVDSMLTQHGFVVRRANRAHQVWDAVLEEAGKWLKNDLRDEFGAGGMKKPTQATALGSIDPVRQTSAVYLRPVKLDGKLIFSAFEAPHEKVLGETSKRKHSEPILESRDFMLNPPN